MSRKLKYLMKSKSIRFVRDLKDKSHKVNSLTWNKKEVYYRTSSSDMTLIYEILLKSKFKSEYFFPKDLDPKVIFDIGGNIGITSILLAKIFPDSQIYTFEPIPDNFKVLQKNTNQYNNIQAFNFGLGSKNGKFEVYLSNDSENYGGVSFYPDPNGNKEESSLSCYIKNIDDIINELGINHIDIIKIDTEGAEYDILMSLKESILKNSSWITGELHGNKDFELISYLTKLGFSIGLKKLIDNRLFMFHAGKPDVINGLTRREIKSLK
jgi:FkbM family methyltransferase